MKKNILVKVILIGVIFGIALPGVAQAQFIPPSGGGGGTSITSRLSLYNRDDYDPEWPEFGNAYTEFYNAQNFGVVAELIPNGQHIFYDGAPWAYVTIYAWINVPSARYVDFRLTFYLTGYMNDGDNQDNLFQVTGEIRDSTPDINMYKKEDTNIQWNQNYYSFLLANQYAYSGYNEVYFRFKASVDCSWSLEGAEVNLGNLGIQIIQAWSSY